MPDIGRCPASGSSHVLARRPPRDGCDRGLGMRTFFEAVTGFPTFLFTVPLLAALGFWSLVAVGAADSDTFDGDADLGVWGLGGVPVAVAFSLWTGFAWSCSLGVAVLLDPVALSGPARALTGLTVFGVAALASWWVTRVLVRLLRRLHPDEPGPSWPDCVGLTCTSVRNGLTTDAAGPKSCPGTAPPRSSGSADAVPTISPAGVRSCSAPTTRSTASSRSAAVRRNSIRTVESPERRCSTS